MNTSEKPTLLGEKVRLRPYREGDAAALYQATLDPETNRLTGTHATFTLEQIRDWCLRIATVEGRVDLVIESLATGQYLGEVVLNDIDESNRSAGFRIALASPEHFGKGYGSEASRLMLRFGFESLGLNRIQLEVYAFNDRAIRTYERLGFKLEGRLREALLQDGEYHDALVMGLLSREFLPEARGEKGAAISRPSTRDAPG